jgi:hypothetical protein
MLGGDREGSGEELGFVRGCKVVVKLEVEGVVEVGGGGELWDGTGT